MVVICEHCHYEFDGSTWTGQCPDCGKTGYIRQATTEESKAFNKRKKENVWTDKPVANMVG